MQDYINLILGAGLSILGWFGREIWAAIKEMKEDLSKLREDIPKSYVPKDEYRDDIREIKAMLSKLFDKLDSKADK